MNFLVVCFLLLDVNFGEPMHWHQISYFLKRKPPLSAEKRERERWMPRDDCGQDMKRLENGQIRAARRDGCDDGVFGASRHQQEMSNNLKKKRKEKNRLNALLSQLVLNAMGLTFVKRTSRQGGNQQKKKFTFAFPV